jgi:hypothetical protein
MVKFKHLIVRFRNFWLEDISFTALFFLMGFMIFVVPLLIETFDWGVNLMRVLYLGIFFIGIWSSKNLNWIITAFVLFLIHLILKLAHTNFLELQNLYLIERISLTVNLFAFIVINLRLLFRDTKFNIYRVLGAVNVYLLFALLGATLFEIIYLLFGTSIQGNLELIGSEIDFSQYIYFSMTCLTTVGFGDIFPVSSPAKMLSVFLSAVGILYPAVIIARLTSAGFSNK